MDEEVSSGVVPRERIDSIYPMYFGASCAFVALQLLSTAKGSIIDCSRWSVIADRMLQGSAQLLGLLVWKAQGGEALDGRVELLNKLKKAESKVAELKRLRTEDGKANEKVISIITTKEQSSNNERKRLMQQIRTLSNNLHAFETKKEEVLSNLNERIEEKENLLQLKDEKLEEEICKRKELEERLKNVELIAEELRETAEKEAQDHSLELWKHKTAFIQLVSNQHQLEAEMGRAIRQVEATKEELNSILKQREEPIAIIQKLSSEIIDMKKDAEEKDKILSAMLRKSKVDMEEKQTLLKEVKLSRARRKQAELETERWRMRCESRPDKHLRSHLCNRADSRAEIFLESKRSTPIAMPSSHRWMELQPLKNGIHNKSIFYDYLKADQRKELVSISNRMSNATDDHFSQYSPGDNAEDKNATIAKKLDDWVRLETEKYISILDQRHRTEIDAFAEQMRLKDEKLESFHWQLLSMELETKQLQSHIEGLDENLSHFKEETMKLEALLSERDKEMKSLKERFSLHSVHCKKSNSSDGTKRPEMTPSGIWSEVKTIKRKLGENEQDQEVNLVGISNEVENDIQERGDSKAPLEPKSAEMRAEKENKDKGRRIQEQPMKDLDRGEKADQDKLRCVKVAVQASADDTEEEIEVCVDLGHAQDKQVESNCYEEGKIFNRSPSVEKYLTKKDSPCKMDLHALGVSYKIKRLKQQLVMVEKLAATQALKKATSKSSSTGTLENCERRKMDELEQQTKGFLSLMSLLNKQVKRYQNLEEKTDDLCKRMHEKDPEVNSKHFSTVRTKEQTGMLEHFLDEAFQLQRYMVAAGQKLAEIQSKIACSFVVTTEELNKSASTDMRQVEDSIRTLFREIQRGMEVRIARFIGDIEGILACEGIMNSRN